MAAADKYRELYAQRFREADPEEVRKKLGLDSELFGLCARRVAESILRAHKLAPARWGLTDRGSRLRLNLGRVEALVLASNWLLLVVDLRHVPGDAKRWLEANGSNLESPGRYVSMPYACRVRIPLHPTGNLKAALMKLVRAHKAHLTDAAGTPAHPMAYRGHHPGLVRALATAASVDLPQPSYAQMGSLPQDSWHTPSQPGLEAGQEGGLREVRLSKVERDPKLRAACLARWGFLCQACEKDLSREYGTEPGKLLHVHHQVPFRGHRGPRKTDPDKDLIPVCPTCHAVIHLRDPPLTIDEVREMRRKAAEALSRLG